jgi:HupE / UreJ protein
MRCALAALMLCMTMAAGAWAHDIGVSEAVLVEHADARYELVAVVPQVLAHLIQQPVLPERCHYTDDPRARRGTDAVRFGFACDGLRLTSDDLLVLPWLREGIVLRARWADGAEAQAFFPASGGSVTVALSRLQAGSGSWSDAALRYTQLGVEHILFGIDHLLFILSLLLIVRGRAMLLGTITAFTAAHSITLALATLGVVTVPSAPVEASIALSIVFVAAEGLRAGPPTLTQRFPWIAAFAFGLLHGFGFAGALSEIGLPAREIPVALLFFNVGVEVGQLAFVTVVLTVVFVTRRWLRPTAPWQLKVPGYAIGTVSTIWLIERIQTMFLA